MTADTSVAGTTIVMPVAGTLAGNIASVHPIIGPAHVRLSAPTTPAIAPIAAIISGGWAAVGAHHYPFLPVRAAMRDRYPVLDPISRSDVPVMVIRGTADRVVPNAMSAEVATAAPILVEDVVFPATDHNDPEMFGIPVADAVVRLADYLADLQ